MKKFFGSQGAASQTTASNEDTNTSAPVNGIQNAIANPSSTTPSNGTIPAQQRATMYSRSSYGTPSIANNQSFSPHTPSASSAQPYDYFSSSSRPLSPGVSRLTPMPTGQSFFPLSPQTSNTVTVSTPLTAVQNIAIPSSAQPFVQPGTVPILSDANTSLTNMQAHALERSDLHKGVKSLEAVLVTLDEYRDLKSRLAKCEKKMAKGLNDMSKSKTFEQVPSKTLQAASDIFEARMDVSSKQAKIIQKEYEALNDHCAKYFKRIAKEERSFDEQLESLDSKIKKAHASHDKNAKKGSKTAVESHDKFIIAMQSLTADVTRLKTVHASSIGTKTFLTSLMVAATLGGMADGEYKALCESVRKSGQHIGTLNEWLNFTMNDAMAKAQPADLFDDGGGLGQKIALKESEIREEQRRQEQLRLKQLEEEHAMLKLKNMGWTPPALQQSKSANKREEERPSTTAPPERDDAPTVLANLPKLDSNGNLVEEATKTGNSKVRELSRLDRDPLQQQPAQRQPRTQQHHQQMSSTAEGTVIIKDDAENPKRDMTLAPMPEENESINDKDKEESTATSSSDESGSSLSTGDQTRLTASSSMTASKSSEDSAHLANEPKSAGPLTPIEEKVDDVIVRDGGEIDENVEAIEIKRVDTPSAPLTLAAQDRSTDVKKAASRPEDRDTRMQLLSSPSFKVAEEQRQDPTISQTDALGRNREHERQAELEQRLMEAETRLRVLNRQDTLASSQGRMLQRHAGDPYDRDVSRPRYSEPVLNTVASPRRLEEQIPGARYEPDRYASANVHGRNAGEQGVSRSLSTDSERSFVARMRAIYQAEKMEKQQEPHPSYRRAAAPPESEFGTRKVSDLTSSYSRRNEFHASALGGEGRPSRSQFQDVDQASYNKPVRSRYDSAPSRPQRDGIRVEEFGREETSGRRSANEPPHANSCGCWNCSARHYRTPDGQTTGASIGMAQTRSGIVPPQPPPRHPSAVHSLPRSAQGGPPPSNYRRQTMQEPLIEALFSDEPSNGRKETLVAPSHQVYGRRSFEDEPSRRLTSAPKHYHGTVR